MAAEEMKGQEADMKEIIKTPKAPEAIGPYSQAVKENGLVFVSGQIPYQPDTMTLISEDIEEQTRQSLENIKEVLKAADLSLNQVVKTTIFTTDLDQFDRINRVYGEFFPENPPARACVEVSRLPGNVKVEIEAVAVV
jgi:2-iminobutanoate/2-iminopropanoate deaminase